jgi:hypothetical protein
MRTVFESNEDELTQPCDFYLFKNYTYYINYARLKDSKNISIVTVRLRKLVTATMSFLQAVEMVQSLFGPCCVN